MQGRDTVCAGNTLRVYGHMVCACCVLRELLEALCECTDGQVSCFWGLAADMCLCFGSVSAARWPRL